MKELINITAADRNFWMMAAALVLLFFITVKLYNVRFWGTGAYVGIMAKTESIEFAPNAIITLNASMAIIQWNQTAVDKTGYKETEMISKQLTNLIPLAFHSVYFDVLQGSERLARGSTEITMQKKSGAEFPCELRAKHWKRDTHHFYTVTFRDITEEKEQQAAFEKELDLYNESERCGHYGGWVWDLSNGMVTMTENMMEIFQTAQPVEPVAYLLGLVHFQDAKRLGEILDDARKNRKSYRVAYRVIRRNGRPRWVYTEGDVVLREDGTPKKILGTVKELVSVDDMEIALQFVRKTEKEEKP